MNDLLDYGVQQVLLLDLPVLLVCGLLQQLLALVFQSYSLFKLKNLEY